ncbi:hypothetical protein V9L05_01360 [Bernardetia sp. Wsw4-3y2]|uniref:hypothetical protein n=1 Tax=Bernardetia sp. Wsw4-3y2 TaxID=3127471 RepID=UPI0030CBAD4D
MLFSPKETNKELLKKEETTSSCSGQSFKTPKIQAKEIKTRKDLRATIKVLEKDSFLEFWTNGAWSNADLVEFVLEQTGKANLYICTWSITEVPVRKLFLLKEKDLIGSIKALLDYRIETTSPKAIPFLKTFAEIHLTKVHAKITLIEAENAFVTINSSANFTKNPRLESGYISTHKQSFEFFKKIFDEYK